MGSTPTKTSRFGESICVNTIDILSFIFYALSFQITLDDTVLPGADGKIVAWVDED